MNDGSAVMFLVAAFCFGLTLGLLISESRYQKQAIYRSYALYCPDSGDWAWIGECENEGQ